MAVIVFAGLILAGSAIVYFHSFSPAAATPVAVQEAFQPNAGPERRPVYPYSVIPGGVMNSEELEESLGKDALAARHYSDFQVSRAFLMSFHQDRMAYVSYRTNGKILWTTYRVRIPAGERLLTDGSNFSRTRCGNRLSEEPHQPTAAKEPTEEALLYIPAQDLAELLRFPEVMEPPSSIPLDLLTLKFPVAPAGIPLPTNILPPSRIPVTVAIPPSPVLQPSTIVTPEPNTVVLLIPAIAVLALLQLRATQKNGTFRAR